MEASRKAVDMVLAKVCEDPQSGSCPNISYADYSGPVASANPTGSPFANSPYMAPRGPGDMINNSNFAGGGFGVNGNNFNMAANAGGMGFGLNMAALSGSGPMSAPTMENLKMTLRNSGFADGPTEEIAAAMNTLASYGILGMGLGLGQMGNSPPAPPAVMPNMQGMAMASASTPTSSMSNTGYLNTSNNSTSAAGMYGPVGSASSGMGNSGSTGASSSLFGSSTPTMTEGQRYGSSPMMNDAYQGAAASYMPQTTAYPQTAATPMNQNSFGLGTGMYSGTGEDKGNGTATKQDMEVAENIVGAILGPGGKGIVEIQQYTGTNIQISKKGIYAPGTRNRVVSITGISSGIARAQCMIQQRIQQEELKRARQISSQQR